MFILSQGCDTFEFHDPPLPQKEGGLNAELVNAAAIGNAGLVSDLLARGADPAAEPASFLLMCSSGHTHRQLCAPPSYHGVKHTYWSRALLEASANGHLECVSILAPFAAGLPAAAHALRWAAYAGHTECVKLLLPLALPQDDRSTALAWASGEGRADCVELLIPFSDPTMDQSQPLRLAAQRGHLDCVKLLAPVSGVDGNFFEALFQAASSGRSECVKLLAQCCPAPEKSKALALAVEHDRSSVVSCLLSAPFAELDFVGVDFPALIDAARERADSHVACLLSAFVERISLGASLPTAGSSARPRL